ncbi:MAG TPA: universal stress protein [Polyangiaceae bacterium]|nr:universal stress protein [Polyangiaceae bacterium]
MAPFKKILVPVDFSPSSAAALSAAVDFAKRYDAALTVVHVYQPVDFGLPEGFVSYTPVQLSELLAALNKQLDKAKADAVAAGAPQVDGKLLQGVIASEIVGCAKEGKYDLIVISTHGRTGVGHLLMGSVAEKVVRHATCPVLTLRGS